ncbi:LLM class flavin-dependent oxidoreductase [Xinfangfangia sp. D13-10-4-6]|uniref:MupA/Atu3671 family FMN-dependent luciferase-like monooxygenase n=1 Tax=Pseudogemmobacter hezensis TaxID=2737662 RepID=UPI00155665D5|nr:MupA/Atu3671 family FMN-dependent luciferase-like monooxygenase [Pseudogemmobacter hezensis]NPD13865.1 LLM class flavin-dependent oxidoreductase [Pseudogemmobacter hezensis]
MSQSAILIGNETLTRECGALWLARGHKIVAVVSEAPALRDWARAGGIALCDLADLPAADWILSVANLRLLRGDVLARAGKGAVNFHDGPLPEHAGLNAPVWAILGGEARHGVTWHLIEGGVDQGRILAERRFDLAPDETALTLNTRCFEEGLDSFPEVIAALESGAEARAQADVPGVMHRGADRPVAMGRIDFTRPVAEVVRLVRGLDHGRYWNPVATAKIDTGHEVLNVGEATAVVGEGQPGTVLSAGADGLVVACADGAVRLARLSCQVSGGAVSAASVDAAWLPVLSAEEGAALTADLAAVAPHEAQLRAALQDLHPVGVPLDRGAGVADWRQIAWPGGARDLAELALAGIRALGMSAGDFARAAAGRPGYIAPWQPLRIAGETVGAALAALRAELARPASGWPLDLMTRDRALAGLVMPPVAISGEGGVPGAALVLTPGAMLWDAGRLDADTAAALAARIAYIAGELAGHAEAPPAALPGLTSAEYEQVINGFNLTDQDHDRRVMVHTAFEAAVLRSPDAVALAFEGESLTYAGLNARANRAAHVLRDMGVGPGVLVGLATRRSVDLVAGALAILKAGGAYVPMDPAYPAERLALFAEDSGCKVIVTQSDLLAGLPGDVAKLVLDRDPRLATAPEANPQSGVSPADVAYMIYTSGSTGRPKGVQVEHRNVANFFTGMDQRIGAGQENGPGCWLAVTSLSFDISVLELFWTLARGFKVVISSDENRALVSNGRITSAARMDFSLYYWGNDDGPGPKKYQLLLDGARFADQHGFVAVWTPERHFHAFGGPYPNPSVTGAAVAAVTSNIGVRAGSVVAPLHHPARIAEEWAVIDNLTAGRAGLAFASGWHPDDFVLRPENAPPKNKAAMFQAIRDVRALWRGEGVDFPKADGSSFTVKTQPRPVSSELPVWVTTAGNPETWAEAGRAGANVLTHLLGQSIAEVAEKIAIYHAALREAGHDPADFTVTLMLHSYIAATREEARRVAEGPMKSYLASAAALVKQYAWAFPAFKKPAGAANPMDIDLAALSAEENEAILDFAFQRYFEESGLFGTIDDALARVEELKAIGVGEVACLVDYGIAPDVVLEGLRPLAEVVRLANEGGPAADDFSIAAQIHRHGVTHLQCTPSMARMILMAEESRSALRGIRTMMVGGEALPGALATDLKAAGVGRLLNMYGPTETTIWSSVEEVGAAEAVVNIGTPLANQQLYVLDEARQPVAPGIEGELWIGGEGVTRGYWQRPDLTAERFRANPFHPGADGAGRMYQTGDLVRWRADGRIDYIGRADAQVKLRGYRIELGEIEAVLEAQPGVTQAVVMAREDSPGDLRLVAYISGGAVEADLRAALARELPEHMRPAHYVAVERFPLTPNRKVDRKALPAPNRFLPEAGPAAPEAATPVVAAQGVPLAAAGAPDPAIGNEIARIWARVLGVARVGPKDNFFTLGGHSLLAVQTHREIRERLPQAKVSITDIFRFPVLEALVAHIAGPAGVAAIVPLQAPAYAAAQAAPAVVPAVSPVGVASSQPLAARPAPMPGGLDEAMARRRALRLARRGVAPDA